MMGPPTTTPTHGEMTEGVAAEFDAGSVSQASSRKRRRWEEEVAAAASQPVASLPQAPVVSNSDMKALEDVLGVMVRTSTQSLNDFETYLSTLYRAKRPLSPMTI